MTMKRNTKIAPRLADKIALQPVIIDSLLSRIRVHGIDPVLPRLAFRTSPTGRSSVAFNISIGAKWAGRNIDESWRDNLPFIFNAYASPLSIILKFHQNLSNSEMLHGTENRKRLKFCLERAGPSPANRKKWITTDLENEQPLLVFGHQNLCFSFCLSLVGWCGPYLSTYFCQCLRLTTFVTMP